MNEVERIKKTGILKQDFFDEEIRNDFRIDTNRKEIWAIGIDLLLKLDEICKKHNLSYWLAYGTLLGAVRHKGFIPWDDDIDVCMPREDYEKLLCLQDEFENPYFLQTPYSDKGYYYSFCKLRNSNTTAMSKNLCYHFCANNCNSGMSIDIFCVDKWDLSEKAEKIYNNIKTLIIQNSACMKLNNPNYVNDENVKSCDGVDPILTYEKIQTLSKIYSCNDTKYVSMPTITVYGYMKDVFHVEDFAHTDNLVFEGLSFPVPTGYDRILRTIYGNYNEFPPVETRGKRHTALIDVNKSYTYYYKKLSNGEHLF